MSDVKIGDMYGATSMFWGWTKRQYQIALQYHEDVGLVYFNKPPYHPPPDGTDALSALQQAWMTEFKDSPLTGVMQMYAPAISGPTRLTLGGWWVDALMRHSTFTAANPPMILGED